MEDFSPEAPAQKVDLDVETAGAEWRGIPASPVHRAGQVLFIDGVRRVDAQVWMGEGSEVRMGLCVSCAAGVVSCNGSAEVTAALTRRFLLGPALEQGIDTKHGNYETYGVADDRPETLANGVGKALRSVELEVAATNLDGEELVVVDGPLLGREKVPGVVGYVKTHHVSYLDEPQSRVVAGLQAGERTPVFFLETSWSRYSWYLRLPGAQGHPWAGIVRLEAPPSLSKYQAMELADKVAATLPAYASAPHKDPRAPANLYPIKGLEDALRHRLGSAELLYRCIRAASV